MPFTIHTCDRLILRCTPIQVGLYQLGSFQFLANWLHFHQTITLFFQYLESAGISIEITKKNKMSLQQLLCAQIPVV